MICHKCIYHHLPRRGQLESGTSGACGWAIVVRGRVGTDSHRNKGEYGGTDTPGSIVVEVEETNCQAAEDHRELQP